MRKLFRCIIKAFASLLALILCVVVILAAVFGVQGYFEYQNAIAETPVTEKVESIRSMEHFTTFDELPQFYIDAVISVEDKRFFTHSGIDLIAIGRAVWNDICTLSFAEGGSTITQQLAKNQYFTQEKQLNRKFAEVFTAFDFESKYSKEEIFELYVNTIYFGEGYYGIYDAAQGYFGKEPSELTDAESAMLAGLPNAPSAYAPNANPELTYQRTRQVLNRMVECGVITQQKADELLEQQAEDVLQHTLSFFF